MKSCDENYHGWTVLCRQTVAFNHPKQKPNQSHWLEPRGGRARTLSHVINSSSSRSQSVIESNDSSNLVIPSIPELCHDSLHRPTTKKKHDLSPRESEDGTNHCRCRCIGQLRKLGNSHFIVFFAGREEGRCISRCWMSNSGTNLIIMSDDGNKESAVYVFELFALPGGGIGLINTYEHY